MVKLISLLITALGIGILCCCGPHSFGTGLRNIRNEMDAWPRASFFALDILGVVLIVLSYFVYSGQNWARVMVMAGCMCYGILPLVGAVLLGVLVSNVVDIVYIAGVLILGVAGPLLLFLMLRQPEVVKEFVAVHAQQNGSTEPRDNITVSNR